MAKNSSSKAEPRKQPREQIKMPKTMGETIDLLWRLAEDRKAAQAEVDAIARTIEAVETYLMTHFKQQGLDGAQGSLARVAVKTELVPTNVDWDVLWRHVTKTGNFDLIQKRLSLTACRERWEKRAKIPGVEPFQKETIRLYKI